MSINWTEEKLAELKALLKTGIAYSKIAARLSAAWKIKVTKNMIAGATNRYGWSRGKLVKKAKIAQVIRPIAPNKPSATKKKVRFEPVVETTRGTCQFIKGEPKDREFCGKPVVRDTGIPHAAPVWCHEHLRIVYVPRTMRPQKTARRQGKYVIFERKS